MRQSVLQPSQYAIQDVNPWASVSASPFGFQTIGNTGWSNRDNVEVIWDIGLGSDLPAGMHPFYQTLNVVG